MADSGIPFRLRRGWIWASGGVVAFCGCGLCSFGDQGPSPELVLENGAARSLYLRFDSGRGSPDASGELPAFFEREYRPLAWDPPRVGRHYRLRVFLNEFTERPLCEQDLTSEVVHWTEDVRLSVNPVGEGCRIVVLKED